MSGLRILSWNVNGLRAAHRKGFPEWFTSENPDILCLQETKISEEQLSPTFRQVEGYDSYFACAERKGYSGVAIYTKVTPVQVESSFDVDALANEGRVLLADYGQFVLLKRAAGSPLDPKQEMWRLHHRLDHNSSAGQIVSRTCGILEKQSRVDSHFPLG